MPWYRNQDQPQYFYVAEICDHLSPASDFPGQGFETFALYYLTKYGINIQNTEQPLLDVDHTSARLNFLTPRYCFNFLYKYILVEVLGNTASVLAQLSWSNVNR